MMRIALFLTYGGSLASWRADGILERELSLYEEHSRAGISTTVVSYGDSRDLEIARTFPFLRVLVNRLGLHPRLYGELVPWLHRAVLAKADIIKTNQLYGARQALRAGRLTGKPVLVRQGYGFVEHTMQDHGAESAAAKRALAYERAYLGRGMLCQFTTAEIARQCQQRLAIPDERIRIVPNYVDEDYWVPSFSNFRDLNEGSRIRIGFFGRFVAQKNLERLIDAAAGNPVDLLLIGEGPLRESLLDRAAKTGVNLIAPGRLDHKVLHEALRDCDAFACVSHFEGHPKALIEAMTFGMPVIAADSPGIVPLIDDGRTGILVLPTTEGIRAGISRLRSMSSEDRRKLGSSAREFARNRFSVRAIAAMEREVFRELRAMSGVG